MALTSPHLSVCLSLSLSTSPPPKKKKTTLNLTPTVLDKDEINLGKTYHKKTLSKQHEKYHITTSNYFRTTSKLPQHFWNTFGHTPPIYCSKESLNMREPKYPKTFVFGWNPPPPFFGKCPKRKHFFFGCLPLWSKEVMDCAYRTNYRPTNHPIIEQSRYLLLDREVWGNLEFRQILREHVFHFTPQ